ncbi:uncharacterized protein LOC116416563 [Nasonia vitripennis]|uniref:Uncharacterized protein n=1 Tax=Nasonia vitripennis TaxID=7425 RepID=A0A7M7Q624_NASVI|nr:uncharacterized protein LOC116416563 [Nasonia vitripennis]
MLTSFTGIMKKIAVDMTDLSISKNIDNQQVVMLKKLIVLSIVANSSNSDLNRFMNCTKKVPFEVKENIFKVIYVEIKRVYFTFLDLLIPYRYLIKEKVLEYLNILKSNKINIQNELKNLSSFSDKEVVFYEGGWLFIYLLIYS